MSQAPLIGLENVAKVYRMGDVEVHALRGIDLAIVERELLVLLGPSGSGKSTLLNILGGLDVPTAREQGLDVTLSNWRGLYGPPNMPKFAVAYWQEALGDMVKSSAWKQIAERSQFTTTFRRSTVSPPLSDRSRSALPSARIRYSKPPMFR